jgi:F-type H+-transporting ATPase subunit b
MEISWFTVIAQIVNFFVLVWLLKRYLYKPILKAIDEREEKIVAQLNEAEHKKAEAKKEQEDFSQKNEAFDHQKKDLMDKAIAETDEQRLKLLEKVRNEAAKLSSKLDKDSKDKQESLRLELEKKTKQEVFAIVERTISDLASANLENQIVKIFLKRLHELKEDEKQQFIKAFKSNSNPIEVQSSFEIVGDLKTEIQTTVNEIIGSETQLQFKNSPKLIAGIELTANGFKLAWSISAYLDSLEKSISEPIIDKKENTDTKNEKLIQSVK